MDFDPGRKYSLTWQSGFGALVWNKARPQRTAYCRTCGPRNSGARSSSLGDTRHRGHDHDEPGCARRQPFTDEQFNAALAVLENKVDSGQVKQVGATPAKEDLINEQAWAAMGWSGDIFQIPPRRATSGSSRCPTPAARCGRTTC